SCTGSPTATTPTGRVSTPTGSSTTPSFRMSLARPRSEATSSTRSCSSTATSWTPAADAGKTGTPRGSSSNSAPEASGCGRTLAAVETTRLEAFADGVFAIAATLLIIDVSVRAPGGELGHEILKAWPEYAAYAVSFVTIGIMWVNHHTCMRQIAAV